MKGSILDLSLYTIWSEILRGGVILRAKLFQTFANTPIPQPATNGRYWLMPPHSSCNKKRLSSTTFQTQNVKLNDQRSRISSSRSGECTYRRSDLSNIRVHKTCSFGSQLEVFCVYNHTLVSPLDRSHVPRGLSLRRKLNYTGWLAF